jgi:GNAT superfamily N-acetyltransferase
LRISAASSDRPRGSERALLPRSRTLLHGERVEIAGLAVVGDHQGQGVGTALITQLERWAVGRGVHTIRLLSGSERAAAHQFYRHRGYQHLKTEQAFTKSLLPG